MALLQGKNYGYVFTRTGYNFHRFKKRRNEFECSACRKKYPKGSRSIGDNWANICFECANKWFENSIEELKKIGQSIGENQKILKENKEKWKQELVLNFL